MYSRWKEVKPAKVSISHSALSEMDPNVFRKEDAPSVLCIEKPWSEVLEKPPQFDEMADKAIAMLKAASDKDLLPTGLLTRPDTLRKLRKVLNQVLLKPLTAEDEGSQDDEPQKSDGTIYVDALWDEINGIPPELYMVLTRLVEMMDKIEDDLSNRLDNKSTLMDAKKMVNETLLEPLNGIDDDQ